MTSTFSPTESRATADRHRRTACLPLPVVMTRTERVLEDVVSYRMRDLVLERDRSPALSRSRTRARHADMLSERDDGTLQLDMRSFDELVGTVPTEGFPHPR